MTQTDLLNKGNGLVIVTSKYSSKANFKKSDPVAHKVVKKSISFGFVMLPLLVLAAFVIPGQLSMAPGKLVFLVLSSQKEILRVVHKIQFEWTGLPMNIQPSRWLHSERLPPHDLMSS